MGMKTQILNLSNQSDKTLSGIWLKLLPTIYLVSYLSIEVSVALIVEHGDKGVSSVHHNPWHGRVVYHFHAEGHINLLAGSGKVTNCRITSRDDFPEIQTRELTHGTLCSWWKLDVYRLNRGFKLQGPIDKFFPSFPNGLSGDVRKATVLW